MSFTFLFYKHILFRKSCGVCHYTNIRRPSDITLADFWGWEKTDPNFNADDKGASLVIINTERGKQLFHEVQDQLHIIPVKKEKCLQPNLYRPSDIHPKREAFEKDYKRRGFKYVYDKYGEDGWREKIRTLKKKIKHLLFK